jgi:hypothetical protein
MTAIVLPKRSAAGIATPATGKASIFIDSSDGLPKFKDDTGSVFSLGTAFAGGNLSTAINWKQFTAIASASTTDIGGAAGNYGHITGTTTITALGTAQAGSQRIAVFDGALTLTHNATSLILPTAANITTAAGDVAEFVSEGSGNWRCTNYRKANGQPLVGIAAASNTTALSISSGVVNIDLAGGVNRNFTLSLTANVTSITFSNLPPSGYVGEIEVEIKQDATGGRTLALPGAFKALGGSDTAIASAANAVTVLSAKTWDQGTTWRYAMQESA